MERMWQLPECRLVFHVKHDAELPVNVVVAGGRKPADAWLRSVSSKRSLYCADRGAAYCLQAGISPALLVGDCDSADASVYEKARALGAQVCVHPPAKDDTDLQLLLEMLPDGDVLATGTFGGRFDHLFSGVYSLLAFKKRRGCCVALADERELLLLLTDNEKIKIRFQKQSGVQAVSLLPLSDACRVSIGGVAWPLENSLLTQARPYAVSNMPESQEIACSCLSGSVGLYVHWQK